MCVWERERVNERVRGRKIHAHTRRGFENNNNQPTNPPPTQKEEEEGIITEHADEHPLTASKGVRKAMRREEEKLRTMMRANKMAKHTHTHTHR